MHKLSRSDIQISFDDDIGIVYNTIKGKIKATSKQHAVKLSEMFSEYLLNNLSGENELIFEEYIEREFSHHPDRTLALENINLKTADELNQLELIVATDCNLDCKYCYADSGSYRQKKKSMLPEEAIGYLSKLLIGRYKSVRVVMFFGGEPTIQPRTIEAVCAFFEEHVLLGDFQRMPIFTMVTNGTLIDKYLTQIISRYKIRITISIDGPKEVHDQLRVTRDGNGTYDTIVNGIAILRDAGVTPHAFEATYTSVHHKMGYSKSDISTYLKETFFNTTVIVEDCAPSKKTLSYSLHERSNYPNCNHNESSGAVLLELKTLGRLNSTEIFDYSCGAGLTSLAITPDGCLYPCHFFFNENKYSLGNVSDFPDSDYLINTTTVIQNTRRKTRYGCTDCWAAELCSLCPAQLLLYNTDNNNSCVCNQEFISSLLLSTAKMARDCSLNRHLDSLSHMSIDK